MAVNREHCGKSFDTDKNTLAAGIYNSTRHARLCSQKCRLPFMQEQEQLEAEDKTGADTRSVVVFVIIWIIFESALKHFNGIIF